MVIALTTIFFLRIQMMKKLLLYAALSLALCACTGLEQPCEDSVFVLANKLINVGSEGGDNIQVDYSISGSGSGNLARVSCEESWIEISGVSTSSFSLSVSPNTGDQDRTASLTLSCEGVKDATLVVIQANGNGAQTGYVNFRMEVSDISTSSASVTVTPRDASAFYHYSLVPASDFGDMGKEEYISLILGEIERLSAIYGVEPSAFLSRNVQTFQATTLMDDTEYLALVFDLYYDDQDKPVYSGNLERLSFRTGKATQVDMTLSLSMAGSVFNVKASGASTFICDIMDADLIEDFTCMEDVAREYVRTVRNANYGEISPYLHSGAWSEDYAAYLDKGRKYIAWAAGYRDDEEDTGLTTAVYTIEFTY